MKKSRLVDLTVFALLGVIMFVSKYLTEAIPNVHFIGMLTMTYTIVYRKKALVPIYVFVFLIGIFNGFNMWWIPYLYIWTILWGATMLLPKNMPKKIAYFVYPFLCALHGILFGILYAPAQTVMFGFTFEQTLAWIATGLPFDILHSGGNLAAGLLILPMSELLRRLHAGTYH